jgi:hypothetical protein
MTDGYPLVTSKNLRNGFVDFSDVDLISRRDLDAINKRSKVDDGDILMPMIGTIGNPVIAKVDREFAVKNVALIKFHKSDRVITGFVKLVLSSPAYHEQMMKQTSGVAQKYISLGSLRSLEIPRHPWRSNVVSWRSWTRRRRRWMRCERCSPASRPKSNASSTASGATPRRPRHEISASRRRVEMRARFI